MNDSSSSLSWKPRSDGSWSTSDDGLFSVDTKEKGTKPAIAKNENGVDRIERAPQGQTNNDDLTCIDEAHQNDSSVKMSALGLGEEEDVESPWDSEPSIAVEHPDPNQAVGMNDVQTTSSDFAQEDGPPVTCSNDTGDIPVVWDFDDLRPSASHSMTKNLAASTEFGQTAFTDKPKTHIGDSSPALHLGMTSQEEAKRSDGNENNYTHVCENQNDIQRPLSRGQDDRILQDGILTNPLFKQKEAEINLKKMNSQVPENHEKEKDLWPENHMLLGEKERRKTETELYHFMLAHPQIPFPGTRDKCFRFLDKMRFEICNLKEINRIISQKLLKDESKLNSLEKELHHTRDALRETTLVLEHMLKEQSQTQHPKEEVEHRYQTEQGKANMFIGRLESLEERCSHLESESMLLRKQLDDAFPKGDNNEKTGINIQEQLQEITKVLQAQSGKQDRMMEERNRQVNELNHLNERIYHYEKDEGESNVVVLKLLQELCDAVRQLSMSVASLEVKPHYSINVEAETKDLKSLEKIRSQPEDEKEEFKNYLGLTRSQESSFHQEKKKNEELQKEVTRLKTRLKVMHGILNEYENKQFSFPEDSKPSETETDVRVDRIKHKAQAASQENLDPPKQPNDGSVRLQLELRVKDLESELSKVKTSQESCKLEWKKYKYLYREELKARTSLEEKLKKAHERLRLANISAQHLVKEQQDTSLHTAHRRPDLEPPCVGNLNHRLPLSGDLAPRDYSVIPSSAPQTTSHSMETCLFKVQQRLYNNITRELKEAAAEVESVSHLLESNTH
ncbi:ankyrin repeat domain-containing protein 26-like isoform 1-T1 [Hipposideros larvatus]